MNKNKLHPKPEPELEAAKDKKYKVEVIQNSAIYITEAIKDQLPELCY